MSATAPDPIAERREALLGRLNDAVTGMYELCAVYLGEQLGYYGALADAETLTARELAERTGTHERYAREWLEEQTLAGMLEIADATASAEKRRFSLPAGHAEVLADRASLKYWTPQARLMIGAMMPLKAVRDAFRSGGGVPYQAYGADVREGMADAASLAVLESMGKEWIPAMPDIHERLQKDPPARVADIGMGAGWSSIAIARAYPKVRVDAFDLDQASVDLARSNIAAAALGDRVRAQLRNAGDETLAGDYDLVTAFFCLHDMADPLSALQAMRRLAGEKGTVLIADARAAEQFLGPETNRDVERQLYGISLVHCLPVAMAEQPSAAIGTVMRPHVLRDLARQAGFRDVEILPIEDAWSMYYRLRV